MYALCVVGVLLSVRVVLGVDSSTTVVGWLAERGGRGKNLQQFVCASPGWDFRHFFHTVVEPCTEVPSFLQQLVVVRLQQLSPVCTPHDGYPAPTPSLHVLPFKFSIPVTGGLYFVLGLAGFW